MSKTSGGAKVRGENDEWHWGMLSAASANVPSEYATEDLKMHVWDLGESSGNHRKQ